MEMKIMFIDFKALKLVPNVSIWSSYTAAMSFMLYPIVDFFLYHS